MPIYSFVAYDPAVITVGGGMLTLAQGFDPATGRITVALDDQRLSAPDELNPDDPGPVPVPVPDRTPDTPAARAHAEQRYSLSNGTEVTRVEIGGKVRGYVLSGAQLTPGVSYSITDTQDAGPFKRDRQSPTDDAPCFVAGTEILTPTGSRPVETLQPGEQVLTLDHGFQNIRWVGQRTVLARGIYTPIRIAAGVLGNDRPVHVSPQHRLRVTDPLTDMLYGETEVLVHANHLIDGHQIAPAAEFRLVTYCHFAFDRHEIVSAHGLYAESLFLGDPCFRTLGRGEHDELDLLFPGLRQDRPVGHLHTARMTLSRGEAAVLNAARRQRARTTVGLPIGRSVAV